MKIEKRKYDSLELQKDEEHKVLTIEEQILLRPGQWIGSKTNVVQEMYVLEGNTFEKKEVEFNEACSKLIEEIITNSVDEHIRTIGDKKLRGWVVNKINVDIRENGHITVSDNGGINSGFHSSGPRIVEALFGTLFSSSNYDDNVERKTVGTNGVGSALTNLFSKRFRVISADAKNKVEVEWSKNRLEKSEVKVKKSKQHFSEFDFELDLKRFNMKSIPYGIIKYIERRCIIAAASNPGLEITINGNVYKFNSFDEYVKLYQDALIISEEDEKWKLFITPTLGEPVLSHGIVNGAECNNGTHIQMANRVVNDVLTAKLKANKIDLTFQTLSNAYNVFVQIEVNQPEYDSQTKDKLNTELFEMVPSVQGQRKSFYTLSSKFTKAIENSVIYTYLVEVAKTMDNAANSRELKRAIREHNKQNPKSIEKLIDANESNKAKRKDCELWIFEGASAGSGFRPNRLQKTQGSYFLKGKVRNTMDMKLGDALKNKEISDIFVASGLNPKDFNDLSELRYGYFFICTDMDPDGDSIAAQLFTFFHNFCPKLIEEGRVMRVITPLWKATKGKNVKYYYTTEEYNADSKNLKGYDISYFKGIGSLEKSDYKVMLRENTKVQRMELTEECPSTISLYMRREPKLKELLKG